MRVSLSRAAACAVLALACATSGCRRAQPAPTRPHPPQTSGTLHVKGLHASVTVVRDRWGVPHITASNTDDLFFAQGFVQAQDRLFQMDLWKRSVQGRLSEVLGANFIQRDSMTRRIQYRGDIDREWASYGPDARRIAVAFTDGINGWIGRVRTDLPEEFALAGWQPELWRPEDLLNRTDAFLASTGALTELLRARLIAAVGADRAARLMPSPTGAPAALDPAVDLTRITFVVPDAVRRIGTPPFFLALADRVTDAPRPGQGRDRSQPARAEPAPTTAASASPLAGLIIGSTARAEATDVSGSGELALSTRLAAPFSAPSSMYLVHLTAPGWNMAGAARPWLPGVVIGHNERIAWAMVPLATDTQDIFVERLNPTDAHQVWRDGRWVDMAVDFERVAVKGRDQPVQYERQYTSNGAVIAQDRERNLVYTLRWTGTEPGGAGELAALNLARADGWTGFRDALRRWTAPPAAFVYADSAGAVGHQDAGLVPVRALSAAGATPAAASDGPRTWQAVRSLVDKAGPMDTSGRQALATGPGNQLADNAANLIRAIPGEMTTLRDRLRRMRPNELLEFVNAVRARVADDLVVPSELRTEVLNFVDPVALTLEPGSIIFGKYGFRPNILASALKQVDERAPIPSSLTAVSFEHPLAVFAEARSRFNVLEQTRPHSSGSGAAYSGSVDGRFGASFGARFTVRDWDQSTAMNAPGQSGSPASVHYDDLADVWAKGENISLAFTQSAVAAAAAETLILEP